MQKPQFSLGDLGARMLIDIFTDRYEHIGTEEKAAAWPVAPHVLRSAEAAIELIASHRSEGQLCVNSGRVMAGAPHQ